MKQSIKNGLSLCVCIALLVGCASFSARQRATEAIQRNDYEGAIATLEGELAARPDDTDSRLMLRTLREEFANRLMAQAAAERAAGRLESAETILNRAVELRAGDERARALLLEVQRDRRAALAIEQARDLAARGRTEQALSVIELGLRDHPRSAVLIAQQRELELALRRSSASTAALAETRPVSLDFRDANLLMVFEAITRGTGINVIVDKDVRTELRTTIFLRDAKVEDAIDVIASTSQLVKKILNPTTILVYPNTPEKAREYQDLVVRAFYLGSVDAKTAAQLLRTTLRIREPFIDERLNLIVLRESPETIRIAERLLALQDQADAEVMLEVEVLEVSSSKLTDLGVQYPDLISFSVLSPTGALTVEDLRNINSSRIGVAPAPRITLNLRKELGDSNVLANPRIRTRNREKARVLIGDKLPIVTTTATSTGFVSESIQYLDVGLKLEVEPTVSLDDEVTIRVNLEVSSLVKEVRTAGGSLAYQIGTRSANTVLRLRDGETQLLAGLISNSERRTTTRVPGLGDIPIAGRLFSNQRDDGQRTEIVLSITPRIIRNVRRPDVNFAEFWSGTETQLRSRPLSLAGNSPVASTSGAGGQAPTVPVQSLAIGAPQTLAATALPKVGPVGSLSWHGAPAPRVGQEFSLPVVLAVNVGLKGVELTLQFDNKLLELLTAVPGPFFDSSGQRATIRHSPSAEGATLAISSGDANEASGNSVIAVMTFRAKAAGAAEIAITQATPQSSDNFLILTAPGPLPFNISR